MKHSKFKILYRLVLLVAGLALAFSAEAKDNATIRFPEPVYDFGQVSLKAGKVTHEFQFVNAGKKNLTISNAHADCGCTKPEYSDAPVAPGKTGKIKVTFAPNTKGHFTKKITVTTTGKPSKVRLIIKGDVID